MRSPNLVNKQRPPKGGFFLAFFVILCYTMCMTRSQFIIIRVTPDFKNKCVKKSKNNLSEWARKALDDYLNA